MGTWTRRAAIGASSMAAALVVAALGLAGPASAAPYLYALNANGSVSQFDATTGGLAALSPASVPGGSGLVRRPQLAVSPDARSLYVPSPNDDAIRQYDVAADGHLTAKAAAAVAAGDTPVAVAVSPDGRSVYAANAGGTVSQYAVGTGGALTPMATASVAAPGQPALIAVSPDGGVVYVASGGASDTVARYDVGPDGALAGPPVTVATGDQPEGLTIAPDGRSLYVAAAGKGWQYDVGTDGALTPKSPASVIGAAAGRDVAVSPDGQDLYMADGSVADVAQFPLADDGTATTAQLAPGPGASQTLVVAPDGRSVYATPVAGTSIFQWDRSPSGALSEKTPATVAGGGGGSAPLALVLTPASDVALTAAGAPAPVAAGGTLTYTLTVTNSGSPASGVTVTDDVPTGTTVQSATASQGTCSTSSGVSCALGTLADGASATVTVAVRTLAAGTLTNAAHVSALQPDPDSANDAATVTTAVTSVPLATTGAASELTATSATLSGVVAPNGRPTSYRFEYGTGGTLDRQAPATAASAGDGTDGVAVSAAIDGLDPSTTYAFRLVATNADGATTTGAQRTFTTPARPVPDVDLALTGTATPAQVTAGATLTLAYTVTNRDATASATGVRVVVPLPGGTAFAAAASSSGCDLSADGSTATCAVGTLGPGAAATVRVALTAGQAGALAATALVTSDQPDPDGADDAATVRASVLAPPAAPAPAPAPTPAPTPTPTPTPTPVKTGVTLGTPAQHGTAVRVPLRCSAAQGTRCRGTLTLTTAVRSWTRVDGKCVRRTRTVTLGSASYAIAAGQQSVVTARLSRQGRALLTDRRRLAVTLTARLGSGKQAQVAGHRTITLRSTGR